MSHLSKIPCRIKGVGRSPSVAGFRLTLLTPWRHRKQVCVPWGRLVPENPLVRGGRCFFKTFLRSWYNDVTGYGFSRLQRMELDARRMTALHLRCRAVLMRRALSSIRCSRERPESR